MMAFVCTAAEQKFNKADLLEQDMLVRIRLLSSQEWVFMHMTWNAHCPFCLSRDHNKDSEQF